MNCHINKLLVLIFFTLLGLVGCGGGGSSAAPGSSIIQGIATSSSAAVVSATD